MYQRDDSRIQSSWARSFTARQSAEATSQLTMVRPVAAFAPLATVEVDCESRIYTPAISSAAPKIIPKITCIALLRICWRTNVAGSQLVPCVADVSYGVVLR